MKQRTDKKYSWHAGISSGGILDLTLYFSDNEKIEKRDKVFLLAEGLYQSYKAMLNKGYLMPNARFMSSSDLSREYGYTRQYWEKLINEGKIPYKETAAGMITTDLWVEGYLNNREKVNEYVKNINKVVKIISSGKKRMGRVDCPKCNEYQFDYSVNAHSINGLCRAGCGFQINTTI